MIVSERVRLRHNVHLHVIDAASGRVVDETHSSNLVPNAGIALVGDLLGGLSYYPDEIAVGSGSIPTVAATTALGQEVFRRDIDRRIKADAQITFELVIDESSANGLTISETGIFAAGTRLLARGLISPPRKKTASAIMVISHEIRVLGGTAGAVNNGLNAIVAILAGEEKHPTHIGLGIGTFATGQNQFVLGAEVYRRQIDRRVRLPAATRFEVLAPQSAPGLDAFSISEIGLFRGSVPNQPALSTLIARSQVPATQKFPGQFYTATMEVALATE